MARSYSAVMALIGMVVVMLRGMKDGSGFDGTIATALCWMVLLGSIGMVVGFIAAQTVDESVRTKIEAELAAMASANSADESTTVA